MSRKPYRSTHRDQIVACLAQANTHLSAADVQCRLADQGLTTSTATVYRQLEKLVADGRVATFTPEGQKSACFQLVDPHACHDGDCYHLKCEKCGKLIHLECDEAAPFISHMGAKHGFVIDTGRTVLYGVCRDCRDDADQASQPDQPERAGHVHQPEPARSADHVDLTAQASHGARGIHTTNTDHIDAHSQCGGQHV